MKCGKKLRIGQVLGLVGLLALVLAGSGEAVAAETITLPAQVAAPGDVKLTVNLELPPGHKLNQEAPSTLTIVTGEKKVIVLEEKSTQNLPVANLPLCLTVPATEGKTTIQASFRLNYCDDKIGLCFFKEAVVTLPVEVKKSSQNKQLEIVYQVKARGSGS